MSKPTVCVWRSRPTRSAYTPEAISAASYGLLSAVGLEIGQKRVLIKPNVTIATTRESGIVTDCAHVEGIVRWLLDTGWKSDSITIGEGGGTWMPEGCCVSGFSDLAQAYDVELASFNDLRLGYEEQDNDFVRDRIHHIGRRQRLARRAVDEDTFVINAPKLKTHNAMGISICLKNLMGTQYRHDRGLCGISRQYADATGMDYERRFGEEMCNLYACARPNFNLVDGVISRMGSGFQDGENYPLGLTVAGDDGFAVDFACSYFMGFNPERLLLFEVAREKGLAPDHIEDIDIQLVTRGSIRSIRGAALEDLSAPRGFWVKYHREGAREGRRRRLEQYCPGVYRHRVMGRRSVAAGG